MAGASVSVCVCVCVGKEGGAGKTTAFSVCYCSLQDDWFAGRMSVTSSGRKKK